MTILSSPSKMPDGLSLEVRNLEFNLDKKYFDPNFHPWNEDNRHLLNNWKLPVVS